MLSLSEVRNTLMAIAVYSQAEACKLAALNDRCNEKMNKIKRVEMDASRRKGKLTEIIRCCQEIVGRGSDIHSLINRISDMIDKVVTLSTESTALVAKADHVAASSAFAVAFKDIVAEHKQIKSDMSKLIVTTPHADAFIAALEGVKSKSKSKSKSKHTLNKTE